MAWQRRLFDAGYAGISWPKEFGGRGASLMEQLIWYEEFARSGAHDRRRSSSASTTAGRPDRLRGEEQKAFHLPRILRGEVIWCQASPSRAPARIRGAVDESGDRRRRPRRQRPEDLTSFAQIAQFQELLVRTDPTAPKHKGITWVICPMDAPASPSGRSRRSPAAATSARCSTTRCASRAATSSAR
jgi:alkylation response protein AidB-like acyl-CoA dehydrogenase